jgi:Transposase DDE domain
LYYETTAPACDIFFQSLLCATGLSADFIDLCAREAGLTLRQPRKISIPALLAVLCEQSIHGTPSYNDLAAALDTGHGSVPSRQAVANRMTVGLQQVTEKLLAAAIAHKSTSNVAGIRPGFLASHRRILVQDSTILKLPAWLFESFSGVANAHTKVCNARIQAVYDLVSLGFVHFSVDSYSRNDLAAAPALQLEAGDLVLRDRGYLTNGEIERHLQAGAHCIYRHKTGTTYLNPANLQPLNLLKLLQKRRHLDLSVMLNNEQRTVVRLVAAPVDKATAALRRMRAKKETRGHNPSKDVLALMDWTIFLTTIAPSQASFESILAIYGLRWRIEIIFKSWKSHLNFTTLHRVSKIQLHVLLNARLLVITALTSTLYKLCHQRLLLHCQRHLSLLKFLNFLVKNPGRIPSLCRMVLSALPDQHSINSLLKYCCYDKRNRPNFSLIFDRLLLT